MGETPNGSKDSLNFEDALKAIMKATGAKMDKRIRITTRKRGKINISSLKNQASFFVFLSIPLHIQQPFRLPY